MMIEDQKIGTYTGMTSHLKDQEVRGIGTMTGILKEEKKDQKDADTMIWIASGQGTMKIVNAMKEEGDRYMFVIELAGIFQLGRAPDGVYRPARSKSRV